MAQIGSGGFEKGCLGGGSEGSDERPDRVLFAGLLPVLQGIEELEILQAVLATVRQRRAVIHVGTNQSSDRVEVGDLLRGAAVALDGYLHGAASGYLAADLPWVRCVPFAICLAFLLAVGFAPPLVTSTLRLWRAFTVVLTTPSPGGFTHRDTNTAIRAFPALGAYRQRRPSTVPFAHPDRVHVTPIRRHLIVPPEPLIPARPLQEPLADPTVGTKTTHCAATMPPSRSAGRACCRTICRSSSFWW